MARADAGIVRFRAFRIGLIGAAALIVVAAVIALPHLAGRAEETPPTAPPIAGAALAVRRDERERRGGTSKGCA